MPGATLELETRIVPNDMRGRTCHLLSAEGLPLCGAPLRFAEHTAYECRSRGCCRCVVCAEMWSARHGGGRSP